MGSVFGVESLSRSGSHYKIGINPRPIHKNIDDMVKDDLNYALRGFAVKDHSSNGQGFTEKSLYDLITFIQMQLESKGIFYKVLDDDAFIQVCYSLDTVMKDRAANSTASGVMQT